MDAVRQQQTARDSYNRMSRFYGYLSEASERRFVAEAISRLLRPRTGESVMEIGFGSGQVLVALAHAVGPGGRVIGVDISDGMVRAARARVGKAGVDDRVQLHRGSATALPVPDAGVDAVFMSFTLELFPDDLIPVVLRECRRVLRENGRLTVACMSSEGGWAPMERLYRWSHRRFPTVVDCRPIPTEDILVANGWRVTQRIPTRMWGLAVDQILALPAAVPGPGE